MPVKAVLRSRESRTLALIIILFTTLVVPFHTIVGHYQFIERLASTYLPTTEYLLIDYPGINKYVTPNASNRLEIPIYLMYGAAETKKGLVNVTIYSFGDAEAANKVFRVSVAGLGANECLISRNTAIDLGLEPGDELRLHLGGKIYIYRIKGYTSLYPVVVSEPREPFYTYVVYQRIGSTDVSEWPNLFDLGGYMGLVRGLGEEAQGILGLWGTPILILAAIGIYIALLRAAVANRETIGILRDMGVSLGGVYKYFTISYSLLIIASTLVGISMGLVFSQVVGRLLYILYGQDITPVLGLGQFIQLFLGLVLLGHLTLLFALPVVGRVYGEAG